MSLTIAQINSAVREGLGNPDEAICSTRLIHYAVRNAIFALTKQMRTADTNRPLSTSAEFTPTARPYEITALVDRGVVAWVERQEADRFRDVRCVNKAVLSDYYDNSTEAVCMWTDEAGKTWLDFSYGVGAESTRVYRLQFDKDVVNATLSTDTLIPESFSPYVELLAMRQVIAMIKIKLTEAIEDQDENKRKFVSIQVDAWDGVLSAFALEIEETWKPLWKAFKNRQRTAQNQRRLPNRSGRGFYGG